MQGHIAANKSSINIVYVTSERMKRPNCEYCYGRRVTDPEFNDRTKFGPLTFGMSAFTSGKFRIDDFERLLNLGYTRSGNYYYLRD